ncbi:septal ring lytic transglycosylase RlpA family protein [Flaviaesturariibacter flavus]|uniref:Probable endolytic peptidoglycan transglycosylase RlpA n=1 Tax=Flaviaesturariibacter flavus TaxID=2502780 RepID=A0A4R1BJ87_9BACT|nr:septal ring lytic transglycosylase RlpA family protein [Flaviaesturariibacter flavus]TCJ17415.1 septal ring lytic transglycosylase RlpA family protein [Flaviaesturariibacter flavus]
MRRLLILLACSASLSAASQDAALATTRENTPPAETPGEADPRLTVASMRALYGTASYYAEKFNGRQTATGAVYDSRKLSAACNRLPLGTWIRVTNLRNKRVVIVQVNDRLHPKNPRLVDMSRIAAERLGYIGRGLTQVKVEVLSKRGG